MHSYNILLSLSPGQVLSYLLSPWICLFWISYIWNPIVYRLLYLDSLTQPKAFLTKKFFKIFWFSLKGWETKSEIGKKREIFHLFIHPLKHLQQPGLAGSQNSLWFHVGDKESSTWIHIWCLPGAGPGSWHLTGVVGTWIRHCKMGCGHPNYRLSFCARWLMGLIFSKLIHRVSISALCLFMAEWYCIICLHCTFYMYSSDDGSLG